jgi:hypothetical protein
MISQARAEKFENVNAIEPDPEANPLLPVVGGLNFEGCLDSTTLS